VPDCGGQRFESPQLHQEVLISGGGFQGSEISRPFNGLAQHQQELIEMTDWQSEQRARDERLTAGSKVAAQKMVASKDATALLEAVITTQLSPPPP
jgi:hypothetical protein